MEIIKQLMITGSNQHPEVNDDWSTSIDLESSREYTKEEISDIIKTQYPQYSSHAVSYYEGPDYEDKTNGRKLVNGKVVYDLAFHPWNGPHIKMILESELHIDVSEDDWIDEWRQEIAMQEGMMGGCDAYNEAMGY